MCLACYDSFSGLIFVRQHRHEKVMTRPSSSKRILLGDIPSKIYDDITQTLKTYAIGLFGVRSPGPDETIQYVGSGTFVKAGGNFYFLTATRVWRELERYPEIGVAITQSAHRLSIQTEYITATTVAPWRSPEWGPDIAFLRIPDSYIGTICAHATFCDLLRQKQVAPTLDIPTGLWAFLGAPEWKSEISPKIAKLAGSAYFSGVDASHRKGQFDYLDIGVDVTTDEELRRSFGGVSGGGLWHIVLTTPTDANRYTWGRSLEGVAFYESPISHGRRIIRCHARRSIFELGLGALGVA